MNLERWENNTVASPSGSTNYYGYGSSNGESPGCGSSIFSDPASILSPFEDDDNVTTHRNRCKVDLGMLFPTSRSTGSTSNARCVIDPPPLFGNNDDDSLIHERRSDTLLSGSTIHHHNDSSSRSSSNHGITIMNRSSSQVMDSTVTTPSSAAAMRRSYGGAAIEDLLTDLDTLRKRNRQLSVLNKKNVSSTRKRRKVWKNLFMKKRFSPSGKTLDVSKCPLSFSSVRCTNKYSTFERLEKNNK